MRSISLSLWISSVLSFYIFKTSIGLFFILIVSAVAIGVCVGATYSTFHKVVVTAFMVGAVLGGFCAFRLEVSLFSSAPQTKVRSLILVTHNADETATILYKSLASLEHVRSDSVKISENAAALFTALTTGRKNYVSRALQDVVRRSGISHLLALSGFHLQVLLFFITRVQKLIPRVVFCLSACMLVWFYCLWIGFIPSLWRAAFMYTLSVFGFIFLGISNFIVVWSLTGFFMMLIFPHALIMPGFVLSMLALYGVVHGSSWYSKVFESYVFMVMKMFSLKHVHRIVKNIIRWICTTCAVGVGAVFTTMWYSMIIFGSAYPIGIAASLLLTPVVVFFMGAGISLLCLQLVKSMLLFFTQYLGIIDVLCNALGFFMDVLMYSMNALLARIAQIYSISTWEGAVFFYGILIAICIPYCFKTSRGKFIVRFAFMYISKLCTRNRT